MLQSTQQNENRIKTLKTQIDQLFLEVVSIWRDTDVKKTKAVKHLAARMEELYINTGLPINTISGDISRRLQAAGIITWAHVSDYLEAKYKRDYTPNYNLSNSIPASGDMLPNNAIEEIIKKDPLRERTADEIQYLEEAFKRYDVQREINRQAAKVRKIALNDDDHLAKKEYERVTTDMPDPSRGLAYNAWNMYVIPEEKRSLNTAEGILKALERLPPEEDKDQALADAIKGYGAMLKALNEFKEPFKDLKYATTIKKWWRTVIRYYDHGKHAAGVMDAIASHKYLEDRELTVNAINCPEQPCKYFATLSEDTEVMAKQTRPQVELLINHVSDYHYCGLKRNKTKGKPDTLEPETVEDTIQKLMPKLIITRQKITIQVPKDRDLTREQVGDKIKELVELAVNYVKAIQAFELLCQWRERTADGRVASRRIDAHPKLSDLA
jgi:hypothetical protein